MAINVLPALPLSQLDDGESILSRMLVARRAYDDPSRAVDMLNETDWTPIGDTLIASPFRPTTLWLAGSLRNDTDATITIALLISPWRISHIDVIAFDVITAQTVLETPVGIARLQRDAARDSVFGVRPGVMLTLAPGQEQRLLVRLNDRSMSEIDVRYHRIESAMRLHQQALFWEAALLAASLVIAVVLLLQLRCSMALAALYLIASAVAELTYERTFMLWLFPGLVESLIPLFTIGSAIALVSFSLFSLGMLGVFRRAWLLWLHLGLLVLAVGAGSLTLVIDEHQLARQLMVYSAMATLLIWPLCAWTSAQRSLPYFRTLLTLLTLSWVSTFARLLVAMTMIPPSIAPALWLGTWLLTSLTLLTAIAISVQSSHHLARREAEARILAEQRALGERFARGVVHDVNNLLTVLELELKQVDAYNQRQAGRQHENMVATARRVIDIVSTMTRGSLLLSSDHQLPCAAVDLDALSKRVVDRMRDELPLGVQLTCDAQHPPVVSAWTCATALELCLMNLILRAVRAVHRAGGDICLRVAQTTIESAPPLDLGCLPQSPCALVSVEYARTKTSSGRHRQRLDLPDTESDEQLDSGDALGLFMVKQFVRNTVAGLQISHSAMGETRCVLYLPHLSHDARQQQPAQPFSAA